MKYGSLNGMLEPGIYFDNGLEHPVPDKESKEFATHQIDIPDLTEEEKETYFQRFFGKYFKKKDNDKFSKNI